VAIKPTIYKLRIALSDLERNHYDTLNLTVALHPSETTQRLIARVLAFCLNAQEDLQFTKGLSDIEEPDIWRRTLDDQTSLWIEVGEPDSERIKKATRKAKAVKVYSFNTKSESWWSQSQSKFGFLNSEVVRFNAAEIEHLAGLLSRTVDWSITITGQSAYITDESNHAEVTWETLQELN